MEFRTKKPIYEAMKGEQYCEADLALLHKVAPTHKLCEKKVYNPAKMQAEVLWELLDLCTKEEIRINRRELMEKKKVSLGDSSNQKINDLLALDLSDEKACKIEDIDDFIKSLDIKPAGKKKTDKIEALKAFILTLPKEVEGKTEETTAPVAEGTQIPAPGTENLAPIKVENEELKSENEELQEKVEELEGENEDLQEKVEELETELDEQKKS